jgi:hypothetical protein
MMMTTRMRYDVVVDVVYMYVVLVVLLLFVICHCLIRAKDIFFNSVSHI